MRNILIAAATTAALMMAGPAMAQPTQVTGVPSGYFQGGGCFNFTMGGKQYSLADAGVNQNTPRGGQGAIDAWKLLLVEVPRGTVTFTAGDKISTEACGLGGYEVSAVSSP